MGHLAHTLFFYNIIYYFIGISKLRNFKNILRIKPRLRFLKRIDLILCVETSVNTIQFSFVFLTVEDNPCWLTRSLLQ